MGGGGCFCHNLFRSFPSSGVTVGRCFMIEAFPYYLLVTDLLGLVAVSCGGVSCFCPARCFIDVFVVSYLAM